MDDFKVVGTMAFTSQPVVIGPSVVFEGTRQGSNQWIV